VGKLGQFSFGALSLFSLSHTLGHLEFLGALLEECGILGVLDQEGKGKARNHNMTSRSIATMSFFYKFQVACIFSSLVLVCMEHACGFLVIIYHWHGGLPGLTMGFPKLAIPG